MNFGKKLRIFIGKKEQNIPILQEINSYQFPITQKKVHYLKFSSNQYLIKQLSNRNVVKKSQVGGRVYEKKRGTGFALKFKSGILLIN